MTKLKTLHIGICIFAYTIVMACSSSDELLYPKSLKYNNKQAYTSDSVISQDEYSTIESNKKLQKRSTAPLSVDMLQEKYSSIMKVQPEAIKSPLLYSFIDEWYGVRYRLGGNDKNGIDCSAFARRLYEDVFRINLLRTSIEQYNIVRFVWAKDSLMEGDLVFFRIRGKRISHVGIYLMNGYFVHASISNGIMISSLNEPYWDKRYAGAGYIPKTNG